MDEPDTYGGAKYVSRANEVARPHPSGGDLYGLPRAVDPMLLRSLEQRQNQSPMRFFEAGTQGMWASAHVGLQNAEDHTTDPAHWSDMNERRVNTYPGGLTKDERRSLLNNPPPNQEPLYRAETVRWRRVKEQRADAFKDRVDKRGGSFFEDGTHGQRFDKVKAMSNYQKGTLGQVGAEPGLARKVLGTPSARQAAANRGLHEGRSSNDPTSMFDYALRGMPAMSGLDYDGVERGPRLRDTAVSLWFRDEKRPKESKPAAPRTNAPQE